jgi:alanyl-tRNA synthetase
MMLFGEKYGSEVRVVSMGGKDSSAFSLELCGGTHVQRTGEIGLFRIVSEAGIAAGVRRIEAVTGLNALTHTREADHTLGQIAALVKGSASSVLEKVQQALADARALEKEMQQLKARLAAAAGDELLAKVVDCKGVKLLVSQVEGMDSKTVRDTAEQLKNKIGSGVVVLVATEGGKASIVVAVSANLTGKVKAGDLVNKLAVHVGGKGGGRPDLAMAGGSEVAGIVKVLTLAKDTVAEAL